MGRLLVDYHQFMRCHPILPILGWFGLLEMPKPWLPAFLFIKWDVRARPDIGFRQLFIAFFKEVRAYLLSGDWNNFTLLIIHHSNYLLIVSLQGAIFVNLVINLLFIIDLQWNWFSFFLYLIQFRFWFPHIFYFLSLCQIWMVFL